MPIHNISRRLLGHYKGIYKCMCYVYISHTLFQIAKIKQQSFKSLEKRKAILVLNVVIFVLSLYPGHSSYYSA